MFKVGDKVVYPSRGVATIEGVQKKRVLGSTRTFYILRIDENDMVIMIPKENLEKVGVREIIDKKDVRKIIRILKTDSSEPRDNWNRRQKEYMEKINTGSVFEVAKVFRDLSLLKAEKELSFGERKVLDNARHLIVSEIAEAKGIDQSKAEEMIDKIFSPVLS